MADDFTSAVRGSDGPEEARRGVVPRHAKRARQNPGGLIAGIVASVLAMTLIASAAIGAVVWNTFSKQLAASVVRVSETDAPPPDIGAIEGGFNLLLMGSDSREGQDGLSDDGEEGGARNDVNILLHVAQDQQSAVAIGFPRDMYIPMADCATYWGYTAAISAPLNEGFACAVQTIEAFVGMPIQFSGEITFLGVVNMTSWIGGVDVCVDGPVAEDEDARDEGRFFLPAAGKYNLLGYDALRFLRSRGGVGDGSDLSRVSSQQVYLSSLVRKIKSDGTLTDPVRLLGLAQGALQSMTVSQSLGDAYTMMQLALVLKNIPLNRITFTQFPTYRDTDGHYYPASAGSTLLDYVRSDQPFRLAGVGDPDRTVTDATGALTPEQQGEIVDTSGLPVLDGLTGQTAADFTCSVAYHY